MTFRVHVLMDSWGRFRIVLFRDIVSLPIVAIDDYEFQCICEEVERQKKGYRKQKVKSRKDRR